MHYFTSVQAAAEVAPAGTAALAGRAIGAYIGIGSGDYDALCRQHGVHAGAMHCALSKRPITCSSGPICCIGW